MAASSALSASVRLQSSMRHFSSMQRASLTTTEALNLFCRYKITPISIAQFTEFGKRYERRSTPEEDVALHSCKFLREEIPVRLAHMLKEIDALPPTLLGMPSVARVRNWYIQSFEDMLRFPALEDLEQLKNEQTVGDHVREFTALVKQVLDRHSPVVMTMAQGINELKRSAAARSSSGAVVSGSEATNLPISGSLQYFLDRFYMSRIGIRMLLSQHVQLYEGSQPGWVGVIDTHCDVKGVAHDAAVNAQFLCEQNYMGAPEVKIHTQHNQELDFPYVPAHLYHMVFELLKNSMRAVMEHHGPDCLEYPKINIVIAKGNQDLTVKISDEGGGIPHVDMVHLFTYLYTTASPPPLDGEDDATCMNNAPLAGYGYGLPLSRLYARYFGGDLQVISMEGYGTDAYIYLKVASDKATEILPSFNNAAALHYRTEPPAVGSGGGGGATTTGAASWNQQATYALNAATGSVTTNMCDNLSQSLSPAYVNPDTYDITPETHPEFAMRVSGGDFGSGGGNSNRNSNSSGA